MSEVEAVLAPSRLDVDLVKELSHELDDLGKDDLVGVVVGRVLEAGFEEERVSCEPSSRLGEVSVELELARFGHPLRFL